MKTFFIACDQVELKHRHYKTSWSSIPTLFRILYGTGIRITEAVLLKNAHVDLKDECILIKGGKNGKDRMVPISTSLAQICGEYRNYKELHMGSCTPEDYFLVDHSGGMCNRHRAYKWFRKIIRQAHISHLGKGSGPRLHDIRHTFSVHSLVAMARSGLDLYYSLPILSTYLGHQSIAATELYVRLTAEMYPDILRDVTSLSSYIFPTIHGHETN